MNLRNIDLNLLPILRTILNEASVTAAARRLGLSQPAVSNALNRLRATLNDPLLVRVGRSMRLSPRALKLQAELERSCRGLESLLSEDSFDPATSRRRFVLAAPDYLALLLGPKLLQHMLDQAPGISVQLVNASADLLAEVASSEVDVAIVARTSALEHGLRVETRFRDRIVGVARCGHALIADPPRTIDDLAAWPWIGAEVWRSMFSSDDPLWPLIKQAPERASLSLSYLLLLPMIAAQSDAISFVPKALADQANTMMPIAQFELPASIASLELCKIWSPLLDGDPGQSWFRALLDEAMADHFEPIASAPRSKRSLHRRA